MTLALPSPYWRWRPDLGPPAHVSLRWPLGTDGHLICEVFERYGYAAAAGREQCKVLPEWTLAKRLTFCDRHDCMVDARRVTPGLHASLERLGGSCMTS
jgi:hypothetical protein